MKSFYIGIASILLLAASPAPESTLPTPPPRPAPSASAAPEHARPEMAVMPSGLLAATLEWMAKSHPEIQLYLALKACLDANPHNGTVVRMGQDGCPTVTEALAEMQKAK